MILKNHIASIRASLINDLLLSHMISFRCENIRWTDTWIVGRQVNILASGFRIDRWWVFIIHKLNYFLNHERVVIDPKSSSYVKKCFDFFLSEAEAELLILLPLPQKSNAVLIGSTGARAWFFKDTETGGNSFKMPGPGSNF